jgi:hypothetical protein
MNQVVQKPPTGPVAISNRWSNIPRDNDDLSQGVALSFPILAIGTNQWVVRWKGEDKLVTIPNTEYPAPFVDVVILKAQKEMSRVFYASGYVQGVRGKKPDCWSSNGIKPDETVAQPVNPVCATCPNSAWGSGASPAAPKAQACQQRRRTVIVPYAPGIDLTNEAEGGPMLLSVPPGSLTNMVRYSEALNVMELADGSKGVPYCAVVTRLSYEPLLKFSKVVFQYMKPLDDAESDVIMSLRDAEAVNRILVSKINVDGGEVDHPSEGAEGQSQVQAPRAPGQPPKASTGMPPKTQAAPPAQAAPQEAAPPPPPAPASTTRVGGHAVNTGIAEAVAQPAAPPPSTRQVNATGGRNIPPKRVVVATDDETVDETPPPVPEGSPADRMSAMFDKLMGE